MKSNRQVQDVEWISTFLTAIFKFVWPATIFVIFLVMSLGFLIEGDPKPYRQAISSLQIGAGIFGFGLFVTLCAACTGGQLKKVGLKTENGRQVLIVSNYVKDLTIDATSIISVEEQRWWQMNPCLVTFSHRSQFGKWIVFVPRIHLVPVIRKENPEVTKLREWVAAAKEQPSNQIPQTTDETPAVV